VKNRTDSLNIYQIRYFCTIATGTGDIWHSRARADYCVARHAMLKFNILDTRRKEVNDMKSYEELAREQGTRENNFLSDVGELSSFEAGAGQRREEILFRITTEIEDTQSALAQVEQLGQKLRKYLDRLKKIHQTLSK
jgi:hypothetical protein